MIKISIVAPVYGVEKYIDQFLESIERQTLQEIEIILVDDGSPDNCPQILDDFAKKDPRCQVIHQENTGVSAARNAGLTVAKGKYVYIVDSDDWLADDALNVLWNEAERTNADMIYGDYYSEKDDRTELLHIFDKSFCTERSDTIKALQCALNNNDLPVKANCVEFERINHFGGAPWRAMIRRSIIHDNNFAFDSYVKGLGDDIIFSLYIYEYVTKIAYIQEPIYHYRIMNSSYSQGYKQDLLETYSFIFERMEKFLHDCNKDQAHWDSYYFRVVIYFQQAMSRYFKNSKNPKIEKERYVEMKAVLQSEPYKTAFEKVPLSMATNMNQKIVIWLIRMHIYQAYWTFKK